MIGTTSFGQPAPRGLLGTLRSWLRARPTGHWAASELLPSEVGRQGPRFQGSASVLVVDDNPVNLMLMSALMESRGLLPLLAADGAEAVALASELHFDLILMDLQMPVLDGFGATAAIRRHERSNALPAVPILAYTSTLPGDRVLAARGLDGSLSKPCSDQELDACLSRWCPAYRSAPAAPLAAGTGHQPAGQRFGAGHAALG